MAKSGSKNDSGTTSFTLTLPCEINDLVLQYSESMAIPRSVAISHLLTAGIRSKMFKKSRKVIKEDSTGL
jgi:hypothetical protein